MSHDITVTAGVLLEVTCSCGYRLMEVKSASLEQLEEVATEHLEKMYPILDWKDLDGKYIHGVCDMPGCIWCDKFHERESCD